MGHCVRPKFFKQHAMTEAKLSEKQQNGAEHKQKPNKNREHRGFGMTQNRTFLQQTKTASNKQMSEQQTQKNSKSRSQSHHIPLRLHFNSFCIIKLPELPLKCFHHFHKLMNTSVQSCSCARSLKQTLPT